MSANSAEDHRKYHHALLARDIRRLAAKIHRANVDNEARKVAVAIFRRVGFVASGSWRFEVSPQGEQDLGQIIANN